MPEAPVGRLGSLGPRGAGLYRDAWLRSAHDRDEFARMMKKVWLRARGHAPGHDLPLDELSQAFKSHGVAVEHEFTDDCDLCICLGGDGRLLAGIRELGARRNEVPVLGIHTSKGLGFLHPLSMPREPADFADWSAELVRVLSEGDYRIEQRWGIEVSAPRGAPSEVAFWAMNDMVIGKGVLSRMVALRVKLDDTILLNKLRGDGLIVSSASGSTAYALSAGGPVVHPGLPVLIVTPICPHDISQRPLVLHGDVCVEVQVLEHSAPCFLTADGQTGRELEAGEILEIRRSGASVPWLLPRSVKLGTQGYFNVLRSKLGYGRA